MSLIVFIMAIVTIGMGMGMASDNIMSELADLNSESEVSGDEISSAFQMMAGLAFAAIFFVSLLGCCAGQLRHKCCLGIYGFFALVIMIVLFIYGTILTGIASIGDGYCTKDRSTLSSDE